MKTGVPNSKLFFGENLKNIQIGNAYLEFVLKIGKVNDETFILAENKANEVIGLVIIAFDFTIHDARISKSANTEVEQNKFVGPVSSILKVVTRRVGDLSTYFDKFDEIELGCKSPSLKQLLINNQKQGRRSVIRGQLLLKLFFKICKSFEK